MYGTALLLAPAVLGVVSALGMLSFAVGAIIANPVVATIGGVVIGLGALGFAFADAGKKRKKLRKIVVDLVMASVREPKSDGRVRKLKRTSF